ncbi:MAG: tetratricopeptide repeat protein [Elusimicrobia bacterium]|nr:tetratricopeptide repeat protein [Elusimicrobiota bacterium]
MTSLLLILSLAVPASCQGVDEARGKYDAGDFNGAATLYAKALERSPRDPVLHYDLGNALFKAGHLGQAIASYQRAFDIRPRDPDIRYNLGFALKRAGEELRPEGTPPALFALFTLLSERELAGLQWLLCWLALSLGCVYVLKPARREDLFSPVVVAAALWAATGLWWGSRWLLEPDERGVIVKPTAELRSGPGHNFGVSFTAPEGRRVQILSESAGWLEIGIPKEGAKGWLAADAVEKI